MWIYARRLDFECLGYMVCMVATGSNNTEIVFEICSRMAKIFQCYLYEFNTIHVWKVSYSHFTFFYSFPSSNFVRSFKTHTLFVLLFCLPIDFLSEVCAYIFIWMICFIQFLVFIILEYSALIFIQYFHNELKTFINFTLYMIMLKICNQISFRGFVPVVV